MSDRLIREGQVRVSRLRFMRSNALDGPLLLGIIYMTTDSSARRIVSAPDSHAKPVAEATAADGAHVSADRRKAAVEVIPERCRTSNVSRQGG